jgi:predicted small secreted protein
MTIDDLKAGTKLAAGAFAALFLLSACETTEGFGEDVEEAGDVFEEGADEVSEEADEVF